MTLNEVRILLRTAENYALFRLPNEKRGCVISSDRLDVLDHLPSSFVRLNDSFVMFPFSTDHHPILAIPSKNLDFFEMEEMPLRVSSEAKRSGSLPDEAYSSSFHKFVEAVRERRFEKLVLSRTSHCGTPQLDRLDLFRKACAEYPDAMVYLFHSPLSGDWLGASPELLLTGDDAQFRTVALAGTMRNQDEHAVKISDWGEKERLEQRIVADYLRERIACFGTLKDEWGPYSVSAGHVSHLRTDFYFFMDKDRRSEFISAIHPTPAVCGLPKEESMRFIMENEGYDRSYYSSFLGWTDGNGKTHLYVNIRCVRLSDTEAQFFAGGGILASSDLLSEWNETEEKMTTMKRLLFD
ncbi:MAG: isochorismate synthase [Paludibacteraceae bacterium]|nr:isochorismate synthase [Paludibacteraceae bacterium]